MAAQVSDPPLPVQLDASALEGAAMMEEGVGFAEATEVPPLPTELKKEEDMEQEAVKLARDEEPQGHDMKGRELEVQVLAPPLVKHKLKQYSRHFPKLICRPRWYFCRPRRLKCHRRQWYFSHPRWYFCRPQKLKCKRRSRTAALVRHIKRWLAQMQEQIRLMGADPLIHDHVNNLLSRVTERTIETAIQPLQGVLVLLEQQARVPGVDASVQEQINGIAFLAGIQAGMNIVGLPKP